MRKLDNELKNRKIDFNKLLEYGFKKEQNKYLYKEKICNNQFEIIVEVIENSITSKLIDTINKEEYILVDIKDSIGEFVGKVREEYYRIIQDIIDKCTSMNVFKSKEAKDIIHYIKNKYQDELEYLWEKFSENAIWRNKQNNKWYGLIMIIDENKLGIKGNKKIEIIDLRYPKDDIKNIVDNKKIFKGYHMNKNNWITIKLDGSVNLEEIYNLIDISYNISLNCK